MYELTTDRLKKISDRIIKRSNRSLVRFQGRDTASNVIK